MPAIRIEAEDPEIQSWLGAFVEALRLDPPESLLIRVQVLAQLPGTPDPREPFLQPLVEIRAGPPSNDLRIRWLEGDAIAVLPPGGRTADVALTSSALGNRERILRTFFVAVLVFLLRRTGWHHVHGAGARDPRGRDWLFAGDAKAGKSTTAALLATLGWAVGTDDLTFLERTANGVEAVSPHEPIALRDDGYALLALSGGADARGGRKRAFFPEELGGAFAARVRPTIIMLPRVDGGATRIEAISPREALAELVRWSAWVMLEPALAQPHLDLLASLAGQARSYRLALGPDLFGGRDLLTEMVP